RAVGALRLGSHRRPARIGDGGIRPANRPGMAAAPRLPRRAASLSHGRAGALERAASAWPAAHARPVQLRARTPRAPPRGVPRLRLGSPRVRPVAPGGAPVSGPRLRRSLDHFHRFFPWIALVLVLVGLVLALRREWPAVASLDWGASWRVLAVGAVAF